MGQCIVIIHMSTLDEILELENQVTDEELHESAKGNLQLADDEAKANKLGWFKPDVNEYQLVYIPRAAKDRFDEDKIKPNNGWPKYKAIDPQTKKPITKKTREEVEETEEYQTLLQKYEEKDLRIELRYYVIVYVISKDENGKAVLSPALTWDLAKTKFSTIFSEFITTTERIHNIKGNKDSKAIPIFKALTADQKKLVKEVGLKI